LCTQRLVADGLGLWPASSAGPSGLGNLAASQGCSLPDGGRMYCPTLLAGSGSGISMSHVFLDSGSDSLYGSFCSSLAVSACALSVCMDRHAFDFASNRSRHFLSFWW